MTILRKAEYNALEKITLSGTVLDLGGEVRSEYHKLFKGNFAVTTANLGGVVVPDIVLDLEKPLPVTDASYDSVLLINVLEHIFEYRKLLAESARVLKSGGGIVIVVPYMFPYHASPRDFHRYSAEALTQALTLAGFGSIAITPLGTGVFAARWVFLERLLPRFLQPLSYILDPLVTVGDWLFVRTARVLGKKYNPADYALGYLVVAHKA